MTFISFKETRYRNLVCAVHLLCTTAWACSLATAPNEERKVASTWVDLSDLQAEKVNTIFCWTYSYVYLTAMAVCWAECQLPRLLSSAAGVAGKGTAGVGVGIQV